MLLSARIGGLDQVRPARPMRAAGQGRRSPFLRPATWPAWAQQSRVRARRLSPRSIPRWSRQLTVFDYHPDEARLETLKVQEVPSGYDASRFTRPSGWTVPARDGKSDPGLDRLSRSASRAMDRASSSSTLTALTATRSRPASRAARLSPAGSRLGFRHRPYPRRRRSRLRLVSRRARRSSAVEYVRAISWMPRRGWSPPASPDAGPHRHQRGLGRRRVDGGRREYRSGACGARWWPTCRSSTCSATMQDASLPLTPWRMAGMGQSDRRSRRLRAAAQTIQPLRQCHAPSPIPPMLITGGLNDPRVTYWEPAKWAARLRATKTDDNLLAAQDQHGCRPRRQVRPLRKPARASGSLCVRADADGPSLVILTKVCGDGARMDAESSSA